MSFVIKETAQSLLSIFAVIFFGYLLGSIRIKGIGLGTAAIFLSGLLFGALGFHASAIMETTGLILFITSVGLSAGPSFLSRMKNDGKRYLILCLTTATTGALVCLTIIRMTPVDAPLAVGLMTGAFTTSPGFAAAKEAVSTTPVLVTRVAVGYGIAYPVGLLSKVLFIQLVPKWLHADMDRERKIIEMPAEQAVAGRQYKRLDPMGMTSFSLAVLLGILLGSIMIVLPGGSSFSLGTTGGPLITGLLIGQFGHIGPIDMRPDKKLYGPAKELGLMLFFSGAGLEGGGGLLDILSQYGAALLLYAFVLVSIPLAVGFAVFHHVLRLPLLNGLGSMTASMTCTPSLAVLIQTAGTDDVAAAYATTYPIALVALVLISQTLAIL